jgi:hypothetical protein
MSNKMQQNLDFIARSLCMFWALSLPIMRSTITVVDCTLIQHTVTYKKFYIELCIGGDASSLLKTVNKKTKIMLLNVL